MAKKDKLQIGGEEARRTLQGSVDCRLLTAFPQAFDRNIGQPSTIWREGPVDYLG